MTQPDVIDPQHALDTLRVARMRIRNGWTRNRLGATASPTGGVCAMGALVYADGRHIGVDEANHLRVDIQGAHIVALLAQAINEVWPHLTLHCPCSACNEHAPVSAVMYFNDSQASNVYDVLRVFDRAIQLAEDLLYGEPESDPLPEVKLEPIIFPVVANGGGTIVWDFEDPFVKHEPKLKELVSV